MGCGGCGYCGGMVSGLRERWGKREVGFEGIWVGYRWVLG